MGPVPVYEYRAFNTAGRAVKGIVDADSSRAARLKLRRNGIFPYRAQRNVARFGEAKEYGWSEEKARHYAVPEREDFGAYVKRRGFRLE